MKLLICDDDISTIDVIQSQLDYEELGISKIFRAYNGQMAKEIIEEENLNEAETRRFLEDSFKNGEIKTTGTDIDKIMPPVSRFGGGNRLDKKETIIEKIKKFFEKYFGISHND